MGMLNRKLRRDLLSSKGLFFAVVIIVFLAVAFFGSMFMAYQNLSSSYDYSYNQLRFADFTVKTAQDASESQSELASINGVKAVTGRMNADFALTIADRSNKTVLARVISLPSSETERDGMVNDVLVTKGSYFNRTNGYSLLVEKNFADHHRIEPGQMAWLTVDGQKTEFEIAGIAASPEYIFPAKSRQEIMVSSEVWGVVFVPDSIVSTLLHKPITEFCFLTKDGTNEADVIEHVTETLSPYGVMDVVTREDQPSNAGLNMDLEQFATLSELFPLLFIIVGAMAIYIILTRIVYNQRTQIGLMRAVGHSRKQIMLHYISFALVIGMIGSAAGIIAGYFLSEGITHFYATMINLPFTTTDIHWISILEGLLLGLIPCAIAGFIPALSASRVLPAEAMRPPAPSAGRRLLLERIFPFLTKLSSVWKLPLRNIFRNRRRSLYTTIGIVFGVSLILVSAAMIDSMYDLISFQFNDIQKYDARIEFAEPRPSDLTQEMAGWDGVKSAEPLLEIPAMLKNGANTYATLIRALPENTKLYGLYSTSRTEVSPPKEGIFINDALRKELNTAKGDQIIVQTKWGSTEIKVTGFTKEPMGSLGYMNLSQAHSMLGGMDIISGALLEVEPANAESVREHAYETGAASVELTSETKDRVDEMMASGIAMLWLMLLFGAALALAIVFTTVTVNILERRREIATMRTLGESKRRISAMITIENLLLGMAGLIPGIVLGYVIALYFFSLFQGDMFSMDLVIFPRTYVLTMGIVILIMLISQAPGIRNINRLNLAQVTKEQAN